MKTKLQNRNLIGGEESEMIPHRRFNLYKKEKKIFFTKNFDVTIDITTRWCYINIIR